MSLHQTALVVVPDVKVKRSLLEFSSGSGVNTIYIRRIAHDKLWGTITAVSIV